MTRLAAILSLALLGGAAGHAICKEKAAGKGNYPPLQVDLPFCGSELSQQMADGVCCDAAMDKEREDRFNAALAAAGGALPYACQAALKEVMCGDCHPWNLHLFEVDDKLTLCPNTCTDFETACGTMLTLEQVDKSGTPNRCGNEFYCFPYIPYVIGGIAYDNLSVRWPSLEAGTGGNFLPDQITDMRPQPGDADRTWWVAAKTGTVWTFPDAITSPTELVKVLDISERVTQLLSSEHGLLGMIPSPNFAEDKYVFIYYLDQTAAAPRGGDFGDFAWTETARLSRFTIGYDGMIDKASETKFLEFGAICCSHKGGSLNFHNDMLYLSVGDGGNSEWAQDRSTWWGKILRIDPFTADAARNKPYSIPASNPFKDNTNGYRPEIYAYGLRNPFRCSISPEDETDDGYMICGVVGEGQVESFVSIEAGANYGWPAVEGSKSCYQPSMNCDGDYHEPLINYCHEGVTVEGVCDSATDPFAGNAAIFGKFYTGTLATQLMVDGPDGTKQRLLNKGDAVAVDWNAKQVFRMRPNKEEEGKWDFSMLYPLEAAPMIAIVAQDWDGELFLVDWFTSAVYNLPGIDAGDDGQALYPVPAPTLPPSMQTPTPADGKVPTTYSVELRSCLVGAALADFTAGDTNGDDASLATSIFQSEMEVLFDYPVVVTGTGSCDSTSFSRRRLQGGGGGSGGRTLADTTAGTELTYDVVNMASVDDARASAKAVIAGSADGTILEALNEAGLSDVTRVMTSGDYNTIKVDGGDDSDGGSSDSGGGLGTGGIVAIAVVGCVVAVLVVGGAIVVKRRKSERAPRAQKSAAAAGGGAVAVATAGAVVTAEADAPTPAVAVAVKAEDVTSAKQ